MVTESGLKLRTKLESAKTLKSTTGTSETLSAGGMTVVGNTLGVVVEDAGTSSDFVLVYEAEKIVVPKATGTGRTLAVGATVYYDGSAKKVTDVATANTKCGKALEAAGESDGEVLMDLIVLA